MTTNSELQKRRMKAIPRGVSTAFPVFAKTAKNSEIWDVEGRRYVDFVGGISVVNTGHSHPKINQAVKDQIDQFSHTAFQVMAYESSIELAEKLNAMMPGDTPKKTIFLTTGAEALENAVKIARAHTKRPGIITFVGGFHGRTIMTSAMTGKVDPYKNNFGPYPGSVYHIPYPLPEHGISEESCFSALKNLFKADIEAEEVAAIVLEPVQGEGGFYAASPAFFKKLRDICDEHGICLVCDEVQSCFGRTGTMFASEQIGVEPDLITAAKSLAGGYPLSAVIGKANIMDAAEPGGLGGTYSASPIGCAASLAVINVIKEENLLARSHAIGKMMVDYLSELKANDASLNIGNIRTKGAMFAFELIDDNGKVDAKKAKAVMAKALENGLLLLSCGLFGNTIRVMVPLTVSDDVLNEGLILLKKTLQEV
ncbi:MAG: 4-aminobutyrate--2-oxoglutarate transaminase [Ostreibacterium sp.]